MDQGVYVCVFTFQGVGKGAPSLSLRAEGRAESTGMEQPVRSDSHLFASFDTRARLISPLTILSNEGICRKNESTILPQCATEARVRSQCKPQLLWHPVLDIVFACFVEDRAIYVYPQSAV